MSERTYTITVRDEAGDEVVEPFTASSAREAADLVAEAIAGHES